MPPPAAPAAPAAAPGARKALSAPARDALVLGAILLALAALVAAIAWRSGVRGALRAEVARTNEERFAEKGLGMTARLASLGLAYFAAGGERVQFNEKLWAPFDRDPEVYGCLLQRRGEGGGFRTVLLRKIEGDVLLSEAAAADPRNEARSLLLLEDGSVLEGRLRERAADFLLESGGRSVAVPQAKVLRRFAVTAHRAQTSGRNPVSLRVFTRPIVAKTPRVGAESDWTVGRAVLFLREGRKDLPPLSAP